MNDFREEQATRNVIIGVCIAAGIILTYLTNYSVRVWIIQTMN